MIVVPTKELGVQTVMLIYKLFGGSIHSGIPGDPTNMFSYSGPRGVKVSRLLKEPFQLADGPCPSVFKCQLASLPSRSSVRPVWI